MYFDGSDVSLTAGGENVDGLGIATAVVIEAVQLPMTDRDASLGEIAPVGSKSSS